MDLTGCVLLLTYELDWLSCLFVDSINTRPLEAVCGYACNCACRNTLTSSDKLMLEACVQDFDH